MTPTRIGSFAEFERTFGGLWNDSPMTFAVYQFYLNGGGDALIMRLSNGVKGAAIFDAESGMFALEAKNAGTWSGRGSP